ncbi:PD40 domain-containing protein [Muricauda sp. CAU 1633]|uniref:PD40 domain-containing protein n=1 Tax=Allomuricauda sp. CAU 1633 TaxID=2816036 RepID=UPI001A8D6E7B|nr:PD40 domain-containing protein [Muricauda sp. CAU 1633]MBO0320848.1 PD40 domain-containing protein [Muricauda sp. CAU 1633]
MNKPSFISFLLLLALFGCKRQGKVSDSTGQSQVKGPFFGVIPTEQPKLLAPEFLATPESEYNGTFSTDGTQFFYTTDVPENAYITYTQMQADSTWSKPKIAPFSKDYAEYDPLFSPDGTRLYYSSRRPKNGNQNSGIWYVERKDSFWNEPTYVRLTGDMNEEYYSSLTNNGVLYFNIWSRGDIYKAEKKDSVYEVEPLPETINKGGDKGDPFISPNEDYLIFRGYDNSLGRGDLYISFNIDGHWTEPENMGAPINSEAHEICPWVSPDGKLFVFASDRILDGNSKPYNSGKSNVYVMSADFIQKLKQKHL